MCCFWSLEYLLAQTASHPGLYLTLPPSSHKPLNCYTLCMQPLSTPPPPMFSILLVKSYLAVYALLQSKDSRRAKTIYQFPRLFSSVIATIVFFIMAPAPCKDTWCCSQISGHRTGSMDISAVSYCASGGKTRKCKKDKAA